MADKRSVYITVNGPSGSPRPNVRVSIMQAGFAGGMYDQGVTRGDGTVVLSVSARDGEKIHAYVDGKETYVGPIMEAYGFTVP